jgi:triacylglycerol esterase/lipase EstA (alpha/beta hydrolase family)
LSKHLVVLVPGFLGFQRLGNMPYFPGVIETLRTKLTAERFEADVVSIETLPTSSIGSRAARLAEVLQRQAEDYDVLHLVGHSTGGLDSRLLVTPGARLPTTINFESIASRVRSLVTVSTPHYGTPLATYFAGVQGHRLMGVVSVLLIQVLRRGRVPLRGALEVGRTLVLLDKLIGVDQTLFSNLYDAVLAGLPREHAAEMERLLNDVGEDQHLIEQLTPISCELLNAGVENRPGVRYASILTKAPPPKLRSAWAIGRDPSRQLSHGLYLALHRLAGAGPRSRYASLTGAQADVIMDTYGTIPRASDNDGIVPTLSQVWGEIIHVATADHLDAMGFFHHPDHNEHVDWLVSRADFNDLAFDSLWHAVAKFVAR